MVAVWQCVVAFVPELGSVRQPAKGCVGCRAPNETSESSESSQTTAVQAPSSPQIDVVPTNGHSRFLHVRATCM